MTEFAYDILDSRDNDERDVREVVDAVPVPESAFDLLGAADSSDVPHESEAPVSEGQSDFGVIEEIDFDVTTPNHYDDAEYALTILSTDEDEVPHSDDETEVSSNTSGDFTVGDDLEFEGEVEDAFAVLSQDEDEVPHTESEVRSDTPGDFTVGDEVPADVAFDLAMLVNGRVVSEDDTSNEASIEDEEVLGGRVTSNSPGFQQYEAERAAVSAAILRHEPLTGEVRDWEISLGPASAPAGETLLFTNTLQAFFRGEKVMATDTATPAGTGTRITRITVGARTQRPGVGGGTLTSMFAASALGNGTLWDTCQPGLSIAVEVSFISAVTFDMTIFGKCII